VKIYCSERKKKVEFEPLIEGKVGMYVCGPTVYDSAHLGHGRSSVAFDVIRRYLIYRGYEINYVSNYTDIDDKMIKRAEEEGISVPELAERVIPEYERDYGKLKVMRPDVEPLATDHVEEMIELVRRLEKKGHTYVLDDGVYFDIKSFAAYGEFSGQDMDELQSGARVEAKSSKRNHQDFVLWKFKKDGEPFWSSPWGDGRPGWHIECSAMTWKHLGEKFDIHGGGLDLTFPHHECEVAQSRGCFGEGTFAKYWLHNGFITVDNEKMSKSLGNFFMLKDVFEKYEPQVVRLMFLQTHYRNPINFSDKLLEQSKSAMERIRDFLRNLHLALDSDDLSDSCSLSDFVDKTESSFISSLDDDFDSSGALGAIFELIKDVNKALTAGEVSKSGLDDVLAYLKEVDVVLQVLFHDEDGIDADVESLIEERNKARDEKDFARADEIRDELEKQGIVLDDTPGGTIWKRTS
jgi:cysteinyl-tRNA synthetase